jgi:hypothetical protein
MDGSSVSLTKVCVKCGETKGASLEFFYSAQQNRCGWSSWCRACHKLHSRKHKRKTPVLTPEIFAARFWSKVDKNGPVPTHVPELGPCWVWTAYRNSYGYGEVGRSNPRRVECAHRTSWELSTGAAAGELCVLHKCDRASCVNPSHLFLGTRTENMYDKVRKGRQHRGERSPNAILREEQIAEIFRLRAQGNSVRWIAEQFGVQIKTLDQVLTGKTWSHANRSPEDEAAVRSMRDRGVRIFGQYPWKNSKRGTGRSPGDEK